MARRPAAQGCSHEGPGKGILGPSNPAEPKVPEETARLAAPDRGPPSAARPSLRLIDFGPLPEAVDALLQAGVKAHRTNPQSADALFRSALARAPDALPVYLCLYKIHTYAGRLDAALQAAEAGLAEAARQANLSPDFRLWRPLDAPEGARRFALYTLKALAFIHLKRGAWDKARAALDALTEADPHDSVGGSVVRALADGVEESAP